ncbi:uncharacterized protein LOC114180584 [Vigna unguiculata]|uniref:uncharacterized protein LOC114180584 n=1 Tax=Vigna unguiculata TaxID=3917 RepID=UPI001015CB7D|nr:uncharacterized protein LOC114180584 [Vigna unguiculata]
MERIFLQKYFLASRVAAVCREIYGIKQREGETLSEYWERFNKLCASCPQHQMQEHSLIQYFYEGMNSSDRQWADAASGGSFLDQLPQAARELIERKATDSQQYETRANSVTSLRGVHEVETYATNEKKMDERIAGLEKKPDEIASLFKTSTPKVAKVCGICTSTSHYTDECPSLTGTIVEEPCQAFATNMFGGNGTSQNNYDLSSNRYDPSWKNHTNMKWGNQQHEQPYVPPQMRQQPQPDVASLVEKFMNVVVEQNGEVKKMITNLTQRVEKLESKVNQGSSQLPAQTVVNSRNVSAITLRSGKQVRGLEEAQENEDEENEFPPIDKSGGSSEPIPCTSETPTPTNDSRRRIRDNEIVNLGRNVSSLIRKPIEIPQKCKDPGHQERPFSLTIHGPDVRQIGRSV